MVFKGILTYRRYLGKLFIWFTAAILLIVIFLTALAYLTAQQVFMKNEYEISKKILKQLKFNIEFVDETIKNSSKFLYLNSDISYILNSTNNFDQRELYSKLSNATSPLMQSNAYIHSICIYNSNDEQYYYAGKSMYFDDKDLKEIINEYPDVPKQKPLFRKILYEYGNSKNYENVLTYIMYETSGSPRKIDSAVIINARPQWILDNISGIDAGSKGDQIFVMDQNNIFLGDYGRDEETEQLLLKEFNKQEERTKNAPGSFICNIKNEEFVVTYDNISDIGFILFKIQPVKEVYKYINMLRINIVIIAVIVLLLSILISIAVSNELYKPLGQLVKQISFNKNKEFAFEQYDEISYLDKVYKYSMGKLSQYHEEKLKHRNIIKTYWLKKLLTDGERINKEQYEEICMENMINLPYELSYTVCVLKIDNFEEFQRANDLENRGLIRFAVINIMSELLSRNFAVEGVDVSEEKVVLLIGITQEKEGYEERIIDSLKEGQDYIEQYFDITVTASIGEEVGTLWNLAESYEKALEISVYRFILGKKSVITYGKIANNHKNMNVSYSRSMETKLIESIKSGNIEEIEGNIKDVLNEISQLNFNNIMRMLINLVDILKNSLNMTAETKSDSHKYSFVELKHIVYEIETIDEFHQTLLKSLKSVLKMPVSSEIDMKSRIIAETVIDIINSNYWDKGLCSNQIASLIKIHPRRLAKAFKDVAGVSIPDYINNTRLAKAAEMLEKTKMNVYDIKDKVGFDNESYFYRLFKAKFGYTPKDYSFYKNAEKIISENN